MVDVRPAEMFAESHIAGSLYIPQEALAQRAVAPANPLLVCGASPGPLVRLFETVPAHRLQVIGVGCSQDPSVVACGRGLATGDRPYAEIEGVVFAAGLFVAILGHRAFLFPDFDAYVTVAKAGQRF